MSALETSIWRAKDIERELSAVADLRIRVFRDFPYLYDGSHEYEREYLSIYLKSDRALMVAVKDQGRLVGLSSAIPLAHESGYIQEPFLRAGLDVSKIFYFGESVLLPDYRGHGLGHVFFDKREESVRAYGQYSVTCFCAVERPADHPSRPHGYRPLHEFWSKRGYRIRPGLQSQFSWKDLGDSQETKKPMTYWMKEWR